MSTLPASPDASFGVSTGSATAWLLWPVAYRSHFVPNIFCAFLTLIVALTRRCVTSTVAVTPYVLNAPTTALRLDDVAP